VSNTDIIAIETQPRCVHGAIMFAIFHLPESGTASARAGRRALRRVRRAGARVVRSGVEAWMVRRYIRQLEALDNRALQDLGVSRSEIEPRVRRHMMREW
jgi:uncharacterized protein YjiS (DUF1127 family)